jgi:hypothetical protein
MSKAKYAATRVTMSIGVAMLVVMGPVVPVASASSPDVPPFDRTALMMGGTGIPTWNDADVAVIMDQFIAPTYPGQTIEPVAVTTPEELWPGGRWEGPVLCIALCPTSVFGPGHSGGWPDEPLPLWKLSGLFSRTFDKSVEAGRVDLETAMAEYGNDHLVIYGYSQGATVANLEKRKLAEQYPAGTPAPDIDFVLGGDTNLPNGGFLARFPGLYVPILDFSFNGPEPTDTQFDTTVINRQYDFMSDFPLYPLNPVADLNAVLGFIYVHLYPFDVSLAPDLSTSPPTVSQHGDSTYYFFETKDLPLFAPLRQLGVPEALIDVVEPVFRVLVELGYDRNIQPWEPTPARLIPTIDPAKVTADLVSAVAEGVTNALSIVGLPVSGPAPLASAAAPLQAKVSQPAPAGDATADTGKVSAPQLSPPTTGVDVASSTEPATQPSRSAAPPKPAVSRETVTTLTAPPATGSPSEPTTEPSPGSSPRPPARPASRPARPTLRPTTPRPIVRGSLRAGEQSRDVLRRGNGDRLPSPATVTGDGRPAVGPSSVGSVAALSSSTGRTASGGDSSGGDAGGSV